jgi:hypothetical protein
MTKEKEDQTQLITALQSEIALLQNKVETYYNEEIVLRGDKIMMREYVNHFGIEV